MPKLSILVSDVLPKNNVAKERTENRFKRNKILRRMQFTMQHHNHIYTINISR